MFLRITAALLCLASGAPAFAQDYPTKVVKIIVPYLAGAAPDIIARQVADGLRPLLGQPVIVENRAGANGNIAGEEIARGPVDGHAILFAVDSVITVNPHLYSMPYNPVKDLAPVASLASNQLLLAVNNDFPARTLQEVVELARAAPQPLAFSSSGVGSQHQLAMELLKSRAGIPALNHVPYKGATAAVAGTMAGETKLGFSGSASTALVKAGRLRGIAVSGAKRSSTFPDLPTIAETYPGYSVDVWFGLMVRTGTPAPIVAKLRGAVQTLLANPEFVAKMQASGSVEALDLPLEEFSARIQSDYDKYGKLIRDLNIKVD
ncbi:MAG: extra-cytoplasmic solute receptor protein [Hyphomicrobiales bacterium]|nr:extra-cytoplasmic solute receptor protein [Hyphomicrobiales bacterium]